MGVCAVGSTFVCGEMIILYFTGFLCFSFFFHVSSVVRPLLLFVRLLYFLLVLHLSIASFNYFIARATSSVRVGPNLLNI